MIPNFQLLHQPLHKDDQLGGPSRSLPANRQADIKRRQRKQISDFIFNDVDDERREFVDDDDDDVGGSHRPFWNRTGRPMSTEVVPFGGFEWLVSFSTNF